jgi:hypothetical protein
VGNALYIVLQLLAGKNKSRVDVKNFVETSKMVGPRASDVAASAGYIVICLITKAKYCTAAATTAIPTTTTTSPAATTASAAKTALCC